MSMVYQTVTSQDVLDREYTNLKEDMDSVFHDSYRVLRDRLLGLLMKLVMHLRDTKQLPEDFQGWFREHMKEAASVMVSSPFCKGKTREECLVELWNRLVEVPGNFIPYCEIPAWEITPPNKHCKGLVYFNANKVLDAA